MTFKRRKQYRLPGHDYSDPGYYFVTICVRQKSASFGEIIKRKMRLSSEGRTARRLWLQIPQQFQDVALDEFIVMPDHVHGLLIIQDSERKNLINQIPTTAAKGIKLNPMLDGRTTLGRIVRWYKGRVTYEINRASRMRFAWQSRFHDHVVRDERALNDLRRYIITNPIRRESDGENTENIPFREKDSPDAARSRYK